MLPQLREKEGKMCHGSMCDVHELLLLETDDAHVTVYSGQTEADVCTVYCMWLCVLVCVPTSRSSSERARLRRLERPKERLADKRWGSGGKPIVRPRNRPL